MNTQKVVFKTMDQYLASLPEETQKILEQIRTTIQAAAPEAREKISYQIAAFELNGSNLVHFAGWKNHVSMYPVPSGAEAIENELAPYVTGKGTMQFPLNKPMPLELIRKIVDLRVAENIRDAAAKLGKGKSK